jgi:hypothetical protein
MEKPLYRMIVPYTAWSTCLLLMTLSHAQQQAEPSMDVLTADEWERVDGSVDRALAWLASQQQRDGSFPTLPHGQPAVTSLCVLAFMAHGHLPGEGEYGAQLEQALGSIASCQKKNGLIALTAPNGPEINRNVPHLVGSTSAYNHAISALALSESFSTGSGKDAAQLEPIISRALEATVQMQRWPKRRPADHGGWRYVNVFDGGEEPFSSDLSVSGWHLMSLRSAKNAGFDVPKETIDDAIAYVRRCFQPKYGTFQIMATTYDRRSRGMAGAGILALAHAGFHDAPEVKLAGDWLLKYHFNQYNRVEDFNKSGWIDDRYHYGVFQCCQGMYQLGGHYWEKFFPPTVKTLLDNQGTDGSWPPESHQADAQYGRAYTTALVVLALGAPNQLLPIFQR